VSIPDLDALTRWRLILGDAADGATRAAGGAFSAEAMAMDAAMDWLYGREDEDGARNISRQGGRGGSSLTTPQWINDIHRLFPKETIERLEKDAIERYAITDIVTNPGVLERAEPNETLLKAVLRTKHLMSPDILVLARKLVQEVVRQLMEKLSRDLAVAFSGTLDRRRHTRLKHASSMDFRRVLKDNLKHYDPDSKKLTVEHLHFFARNQRHMKNWQVILLVDQSGSMLDSVIHSAVTAACLWGLPGIRTHLVAFDTNVVDLTREVDDPVELLMKVQLGGGTDIQKAVGYATDIIEQPDHAIVVLISDFFEGSSGAMLVQRVRQLASQRTLVLGLAALDSEAEPAYDRDMARQLVEAGAEVGAMTPGELAGWLASKIAR
jgi:Mg-chelatase subunit ChlD